MLRTFIKLAITALLIHGAWRVCSAYWTFYQFEDRLTQIAQFGDRRSDRELCDEALRAAGSLRLPLLADAVSVHRASNPPFNCGGGFDPRTAGAPQLPRGKINVQAFYTQEVLILPGYRYPWAFKPSIEVWARAY